MSREAEERKQYTIQAVGEIGKIPAATWDRCANPAPVDGASSIPFDPFVSHAFLHALETSDSACPRTGWAPYHLALEDEAGTTLGVVPMYLKSHSRGEYIFDHSWADAFERAGGRYYPKLLIAVPFTPAGGRRLLTGAGSDTHAREELLLAGCMQVCRQLEVSSLHINFPDREQWERMGAMGFLQRTHKQYHWQNRDYGRFADFLGDLSSKKRKNIRRERRGAVEDGIDIERLTGDAIREEHWDAFYSFYLDTGNRKWGVPYLTREFYSRIGETMAEHILLVMCKRGGRYIAGAINFIGGECLFGRNWGCLEDHRFLHFEVCYYQAIEFAIERGLQRVEAGAQGPHKLARGYMPSHTYSAHWIAHDGFHRAVADFLEHERVDVDEEIDYIEEHSPFRRS